ncbi:MAG: class I SAM-dependent methyltransferase [Armatimonadetes bacterium]|nr:class I SAM-dependent methyltransferase [Armatimonadota bacterium]
MSRIYGRYAAIYDRTGQGRFSIAAWHRAQTVLRDLEWQGRDVLELACGTGVLAAHLSGQGLDVVALDLSPEMLLVARERAAQQHFPVVCGDARALPLADASFDLVTSFYDSMNYLLTTEDLAAALHEVARVLRPGGLFVFDLNTPYTLSEHWTGLCDARADADIASIWRAEWQPERHVSSLRATFFVQGLDGRYDRFDEVHDERGFSDDELETAFREARLKLVRSEDPRTGRRPARDSRRVFYYLQKRRRNPA